MEQEIEYSIEQPVKYPIERQVKYPIEQQVKYPIEQPVKYPKTIRLKNRKEFNSIEHMNMLIEFAPGGQVGDDEWNLQYMHNTSVLCEYHHKKEQLKSKPLKLNHYVIVPKIGEYIDLLVDGLLLCRYYINNLYLRDYYSKIITPNVSNVNINDDEQLLFIEPFDSNLVSCQCDGKNIDIHFAI